MDILFEKINNIDITKTNLYFFTKSKGKTDTILNHVELDTDMKGNLFCLIEDTITNKKIEEKELVEFCPISSRKDTIERSKLEQFNDLDGYIRMIIENQEIFLDVEKNSEDFYCIQLITTSDENIFCFNKVEELKALRKKWLGRLTGEFSKYQIPDNIISLGNNISTIVIADEVYIFNKSVFRQIVDIDKLIEDRATGNLEEIKAQKIIENYDDFEKKVLKQKRSLNISAKASQRNVVSKVVAERAKMQVAADRLFKAGKIDSEINFHSETQNIVYSEGQERDILILLNDLGYETLILNEMDINE